MRQTSKTNGNTTTRKNRLLWQPLSEKFESMMNKMAPTVSSLQLVTAAAAAAAAVCLIAKLAIADCWNELLLDAELLTLGCKIRRKYELLDVAEAALKLSVMLH